MSDGYVLPCGNLNIAIDRWNAKDATAYFLTHMHADHYKGLHNEWCRGLIYCSEVTRLLLIRKWPTLRNRTKGFVVDDTVSIHLAQQELLSVTLIDANHCPGSVMFLFEGACGRVLHTGDFRWEVQAQAELLQHPALSAGPLDLLVLDNTYCHARYAFPSRLEGCRAILQVIQAHAHMDIVIAVDSLGKEDLLAAVAHATGTCMGIAADRLETIITAGLPAQLFTTEMGFTRIRALPKWMVTAQFLAKLNRRKPTIGIIPTGFACLNPDKHIPTGRDEHCIALAPAETCFAPQDEQAPSAWHHQLHQQQHSQQQSQEQCSQQQQEQLHQLQHVGERDLSQQQRDHHHLRQQQHADTPQQGLHQAQHRKQHQTQGCAEQRRQPRPEQQQGHFQMEGQLEQQQLQPQPSDQLHLPQIQQHAQEHQQPSAHEQHHLQTADDCSGALICLSPAKTADSQGGQLHQPDGQHQAAQLGWAGDGNAQFCCPHQTDVYCHPQQSGLAEDGSDQLTCPKQLDGQVPDMPHRNSNQLFSSTEALQVDLEAYAALVHSTETSQAKSTEETEAAPAAALGSASISAAEIEHARPLLKRVPYSLHNNFEELQSFVAHLRPHAIAPIVTKTYDSRYPIDPNLHFKHLLWNPKQTTELSTATGRRAVQTAPGGCTKGLTGLSRRGTKRVAKSLGGSDGQENTAQHGSWQGFLRRCAGSVKQRRYSAPSRQRRCVSGKATAICAPQELTALHALSATVKQEMPEAPSGKTHSAVLE